MTTAKSVSILSVLLFCLIPEVKSYNYLVFCPLIGHSHTTFFAKIADTLTDAGHNVTFFTPTIIRHFEDVEYVKTTKNVIRLKPSEELAAIGDLLGKSDITKFWDGESSPFESIPMIRIFHKMFKEQARVIQNDHELLEKLKNEKFDVMIYEAFVSTAYPLIEYLDIKTIIPSVSLTHDKFLASAIGEPVMASVLADGLSPFGDKLNFIERTMNFITGPIMLWILGPLQIPSFIPPYNQIHYHSKLSDATFAFANSNPYIDFPRPMITKTVQIGGISVDTEKLKSQKVNEEYDKILNLRPHTVLLSFGSVVLSKDMPMIYKKSLITAMKSFPDVTFIWKYESDDTKNFSENAQNVIFRKWIPQTALLADSRLSAFFTHAGLGSVNELSYLGKPAILCPIFGDQPRNAKIMARHNGSIDFSKYDLANSNKIEEALKKILFDKSYSKHAVNLARQLEKQPIKPKDLLIKHAEFAAEFGKLPSLDPYSRQMSFIEFFLIDTIALLSLLGFSVVFIIYQILKRIWKMLQFGKKQKAN